MSDADRHDLLDALLSAARADALVECARKAKAVEPIEVIRRYARMQALARRQGR